MFNRVPANPERPGHHRQQASLHYYAMIAEQNSRFVAVHYLLVSFFSRSSQESHFFPSRVSLVLFVLQIISQARGKYYMV